MGEDGVVCGVGRFIASKLAPTSSRIIVPCRGELARDQRVLESPGSVATGLRLTLRADA